MVNGQEAKPHSDAHKQNSATKSQDAVETIGQIETVVNQQTTQRQEKAHSTESPSYLSRLLSPENLPNDALVGVGVIGVVIAICTVWIIRKQTQALVDSERSWLMVDLRAHDKDDEGNITKGHIAKLSNPQGDSMGLTCIFLCKNDGKVPTWIIEAKVWFKMVIDIPQTPDIESPPAWTHTGPEPIGVNAIFRKAVFMQCSGHTSSDGPRMIAYGFAKYRDVFVQDSETWFGYTVMPLTGRLDRLAGYPEYNRHT
jgi:hypothetical protein